MKLSAKDLRAIVVDSDELAKGVYLVDHGALSALARTATRIFGESRGSGPSPYKVAIAFPEGKKPRAKCTCPSALRRPFCKHAAALLIAWARSPDAFVESDAPPPGAPPDKTASIKRGKVDVTTLMRDGAAEVVTLVGALATSGVAAASEGLADRVRALGERLRDHKLRRLSARVLDLASTLDAASSRGQAGRSIAALAYAELVTDMLLTARAIERHTRGERLDDRHVEELIGKTWRREERRPLAGLDLVEYAFLAWTTSDDFSIRESRFLDLATGAHYSERAIVPVMIARLGSRAEPKPSRAGRVLTGARGGAFPGYPPVRVDLVDLGATKPLDDDALARLVDRSLPDVASALAALKEHRRDLISPDRLPVSIRADTLLARRSRLALVDASGASLHLPSDPRASLRLSEALRDRRLVALIGDVGLDAALPTIWPLAAVIEGPLGRELRSLVDPRGERSRGSTAAHVSEDAGSAAWIRAARESGASPGAIAIAEVRDELAHAFMVGLASLGPRAAAPLAERLAGLGLDKPAALLNSLGSKADPADRVDDFVKLFVVLGAALTRLASAIAVDRASLERVPTYESVFIARPTEALDPAEVERRRAAGTMSRYEAAVHSARYYASIPHDRLAEAIYPTWADGSAAPFVARAFAGKPIEAVAAARRALAQRRGRVAKLTAIRVLAEAHGAEAEALLTAIARDSVDAGLRAHASDAKDVIGAARGDVTVRRRRLDVEGQIAAIAPVLLAGPTRDLRIAAVQAIERVSPTAAIPALRSALDLDASIDVRREAALALARAIDVASADTFVTMLRARGAEAKTGAEALGILGDARGLRELMAAYEEGYKPKALAEALRSMGPVAIPSLLDRFEKNPAILDRKAALAIFAELPEEDLIEALTERLRGAASDAIVAIAWVALKVTATSKRAREAIGALVLDRAPKDDAALVRAARKAAG